MLDFGCYCFSSDRMHVLAPDVVGYDEVISSHWEVLHLTAIDEFD